MDPADGVFRYNNYSPVDRAVEDVEKGDTTSADDGEAIRRSLLESNQAVGR